MDKILEEIKNLRIILKEIKDYKISFEEKLENIDNNIIKLQNRIEGCEKAIEENDKTTNMSLIEIRNLMEQVNKRPAKQIEKEQKILYNSIKDIKLFDQTPEKGSPDEAFLKIHLPRVIKEEKEYIEKMEKFVIKENKKSDDS